ncbi:hypothetical protein [Streptomyces nanshensis]|uniref:GHMP kinase N-terminal domain-containing protein n=1 Tax=Streptomyces nanshensis TaxID=518642 RepID=A0A1E7L733_9ACTN|nr:hypothetical protein [Streptomyces nanshensis]OEV12022.1 hypothetical protein AN218_10365 [Streptomyces nanshensis]
MATETTKTDKNEEAGGVTDTGLDKDTSEETAGKTGESSAAAASAEENPRTETLTDDGLAEDDLDDEGPGDDGTARATALRRGSGLGAGAAAVVSAGLGLSSITGTSLSEMLRDRKQLIGQIESSAQGAQGGGGGADQINALYGAPWHATALLNGIFALLAVLVGGVLLALAARRADTRSWVKGVALGGVILGVIGLVVAGGMYLDLFASAPEVPSAPAGQPAQ